VLLPHAQAVLSPASVGLWRIARYLGSSGSYAAARDLLRQIADAHERDPAHGPEHQDTLTARHNFDYWTERVKRRR
jgi:hypothetical protein